MADFPNTPWGIAQMRKLGLLTEEQDRGQAAAPTEKTSDPVQTATLTKKKKVSKKK